MLYRGKLAPLLRVGVPRSLTRDDLEQLKAPNRNPTRTVERLRNSHHNVAMLAAAGLPSKEIAARTGYAPNRISSLINSPAMAELIAKYRDRMTNQVADHMANYFEMMFTNMVAAERQISDRLDEADEAGETLPVRELVAIAGDRADRVGFGKQQTNVNVNADFAALLEKAIARSGKVIEGNSSHPTCAPQSPQAELELLDKPQAPPSPLRRFG